jgi:hypothetical protein
MDLQLQVNNLISYIQEEWPDIMDKEDCANFILRNLNPRDPHMSTIDQLCGFFVRHAHER